VVSSFAKDAIKAHLHPKQVKEFMHIFADEINFKRDVKKGDYFSVVYEEYHTQDNKFDTGGIVAAEYINHGKVYQAIRFADEHGHVSYYTPSGLNMQRAFMRDPVVYRAISSAFSRNRVDPVTHQFAHPHNGVDLAAPTGTPIRATGDGKITFAGVKTGYGNTLIISHDKHYRTLYAHMDHFANNIHTGTHIQTGQLIGYVGSTGRVTGPHLHYEFLVDGKPNNPLTVPFPRARAVAMTCRNKFVEKAKQLIAMLEPGPVVQALRLADNNMNSNITVKH
jgi:murein DD-endopeptidase MepM/ murein hydrolase activator NlpD